MAIVNRVAWRIGGQQGEGIDSTGDIFAKAVARQGLHIYTYRSFSSRIRGGLTYSDVRVSERARGSRADHLNVVVALGQEVVDASVDELSDKGIILYDKDAFEPTLDEEYEGKFQLIGVPMTKIAEEQGSKIMKNMVSLGATAYLLDLGVSPFFEFVEERFGRKGEKIVNMNKAVLQAGFDHVKNHLEGKPSPWKIEKRPLPETGRRLVLNGNSATSYGALVAGCRFVAGYPITPATDVLEWFIDHVDEYGGAVLQTEDELAAINAVVAAGYAGVRACTSTSGPGLSLMTEAVGLAGMAEIPIVVIDVMRPGPSTGLPTKHSQADLSFLLTAGHDDYPRVLVSPSTPAEAFYYIQEAFNWAEEYQLPVFFLIDQDLALATQCLDKLDPEAIPIRRGKTLTEDELKEMPAEAFKRFAITEDGISPRVVVGSGNGLHLSSGSEHDEYGVITENRENRSRMMEKRMRKLDTFRRNVLGGTLNGHTTWGDTYGDDDAKIGIITWGSTRAPVDEACERIRREEDGGVKFRHMTLNVLWPFPHEQVAEFMKSVDKAIVIENNYSGQLKNLIVQEVGQRDKLFRINKYDGTPFKPGEIELKLKEMI